MRHPGPDYVYVMCDMCKGKFHRKDTIKVNDKYNLQNGMIVCKQDLDLINEQIIPVRARKDALVTNPHFLNSPPSPRYATQDVDDRVPGAPRNLTAVGDHSGSYVMLQWEGPFDPGSSGIVGYVAERIDQSGTAVAFTINHSGTIYTDITSDITDQYQYRIAAVNTAGQGAYSVNAYFPSLGAYGSAYPDGTYIQLSQAERFILTSDGQYILF